MPHTNEWYLDKRVFVTTYEGDVSLDDLRTITDEMQTFIEEGQPPVHNLVDVRKMENYPKNLRELQNIMRHLSDQRFGWFIVIGKNNDPISQFLVAINNKVLGINIRFAKDFQEAKEVLNRVDPTLNVAEK